MSSTGQQERKRRPWVAPPDFRHVDRGVSWLQKIIAASEAMDCGDKRAMDEMLDKAQTLFSRPREPGEEG